MTDDRPIPQDRLVMVQQRFGVGQADPGSEPAEVIWVVAPPVY